MARTDTYFPTGIVTGEAFCNRENERELLARRFEQNAHVVLISPRRYGKSSLIAQFTLDQQIPFVSVDLLPATSSRYVRNAMVDGVTQLMNQLIPGAKLSKQKLMQFFAKMNPVIELSAFGQRLKLNPEEKTHEETIMKLLLSLDEAAGALKKKIIFVVDEFQQIAVLDEAHSLEASIRHAVERSQNVFYIFSGSNRTLLEEMFKNKNRPLYHLCDEMKIGRISEKYYEPFIIKAAKKRWPKEKLPEVSIKTILTLTARHPYYLNRLCRMLWDEAVPPDTDKIVFLWNQYVESQKVDWVSDMLSQLTPNQRAVLAALAKEPTKELLNKEFLGSLRMAASSVQRTVGSLLKNDLIYKNQEDGLYHVLNPVVLSVLANNTYF